MNSLRKLSMLGQSLWLDYIKRDLIISGKLNDLIKEDDLRGITSNPCIFEKAITECRDYENDISTMKTTKENINFIYETLAQHDIRAAADEFRELYDRLEGRDGYVSLEVNPHLAYDTQGTIIEARRLWKSLARPNVFIKVPATAEGLPAITQLISEGINVNATLLFGLTRYREVAEAYLSGIEMRISAGHPVNNIASVASFFLSRIDTLVDPMLEHITAQAGEHAEIAKKLHGQVAIASAKIAYQIYQEIIASDRFKKRIPENTPMQRLLWASTSNKNPAYSDIKYIEALIGPDTINTVPLETLDAYRDHGNPNPRLQNNIDQAKWILQQLPTLGIDMHKLTQELEDEGVNKFKDSFDQLMTAINKQ